MNWNDKVELAKALNQERYADAVNIIKEHEEDIDNTDMDMFATGFLLTECELLKPIEHIIRKYENESVGDFRSDMRIGMMLEKLNEKED